MLIHCFDVKKNKLVLAGEYNMFDFTFRKKVTSKHYMIKEQGYGISEDVIRQLIELNCELIIIQTNKNKYKFEFRELLQQSIKNYGHGEQRFLKVRSK